MHSELNHHLESIKHHLEAEDVDSSAIEQSFSELRKSIAAVVTDRQLNTAEKAQLINYAQQQLEKFEAQAKEQKQVIHDGIKKIAKGRRSLKSYKENL